MTKTEMEVKLNELPFGDGSNKIFGMENFGNTCYCNSILQCLYYTEKFRVELISHKITEHDKKTNLFGIKTHNFTNKYEMLVQKRLKEQQKTISEDRPKSSRKGSIFGLKFNNASSTNGSANFQENNVPNNFIFDLKNCEFLSNEQKILVSKDEDFQNLQIMITRPSQNTINKQQASSKNDYSQSSSMLLSETNQNNETKNDGVISSQSSYIVIGIPYPETNLQNPINPFNQSPTSDQRKRSALINGPIINLDHSLQLPSEQNDDSALLYALKDLFECMVENRSNIGVVSPNYFINKLKEKNYLFRQNNMHHDAHEFCNYLINEIIESLNKEDFGNNWCNRLFQGVITNETKCLSCETITSKEETFLDLSVDVPPHSNSNSLTHSLNNFSKSEVLTHQNKFYCNSCSSLQEAIKTIKIKSLPEILIINFKRFKYDDKLDKMVKLFDSISYPLKLRLFNTSSDEFQLYELYSLVIHIGGGPMHGHYISLCKVKSKMWMLFDDETVEMVDESFVMKFFGTGPGLASAYILFYQKCDYLEKGEESKLDFGFNVEDLFNGNDYHAHSNSVISNHSQSSGNSLNHSNSQNHSNTSNTTINPTVNSASNSPNPFADVHSIENDDRKNLFKKNFKLDDSNTPSMSSFSNISNLPSIPPTAPSTSSNTPSATKKPSIPQLSIPSNPGSSVPSPVNEVKERKSWVGSLRRESKVEKERKSSLSSSSSKEPEKERKKSIFGFKRK
ncbi:putative probable ubiquitin carboxyl-terminal hydrolase 9 [[Candida] jaroonii]|uniref:Probable ubiquitin carboxyl-terminal hydrolase 9 n=1 Tax=[Candida] jaroonii TaxID=467808 RepID=A0ACA9Y4Y0_9ASCO|nr:putative probable ubiquitin carboxyl-terminal hydrolase 9 [[Candida] jaroonii]